MSIEDIKDINKLRKMLKMEILDNKYLRGCCEEAGLELAKHSFQWDGKQKNLVVQAMYLNEEYEKVKQDNDVYHSCITANLDRKISERYQQVTLDLEQYEELIKAIEKICLDNDCPQENFNAVDCDKYKLAKHKMKEKIFKVIEELKPRSEIK